MTLNFDPSRSSNVNSDGANRKPMATYIKVLPRVQPRICHRFRDISNQRIVTFTFKISRSSKAKSMGSVCNFRWVPHRNCGRLSHTSRQKVWQWFLTPEGHARSNLMVPIEGLWVLHISALGGVEPRICHRFRDITSKRIVTLTSNTTRSSKVKSMVSVYNLRWVPHRNCCRSYIFRITSDKSMTVNFDPWRSRKFKSDSANRKPVGPTTKCSRSPTSYVLPFWNILSQNFDIDLLTLVGLTSGPKFTSSGDNQPAIQIYHPAKFQPDHTNCLRDMRYLSFFNFWLTGPNPWAKVHQKGRWSASHPALPFCKISSPYVNPRRRYPLPKSCGQRKTNKTNSKQYIPNMPIGMWG